MIPNLTDTQREILQLLAEGWQIGAGSPGERVWLQEGGAGHGGKTRNLLRADLDALFNHRLIYVSKRAFPTSTWDITESGRALLAGTWTDEIHEKVKRLLNEDGTPVQVVPPEEGGDLPSEHESYGMVALSQINGGDGALFGCSVRHNHRIRLRIQHGCVHRKHGSDYYSATSRVPIVEVEMSPDQLVSLLFNTNRGDGVPCTLVALDGEDLASPPMASPRAQFSRQFAQTMAAVTDNAEVLRAEATRILRAPGALKGTDKKYLHDILQRLVMDMRANLPFVEKLFQEQLDRSVTEASVALAHQASALGLGEDTPMPQLLP